jgi:hypothetical protein
LALALAFSFDDRGHDPVSPLNLNNYYSLQANQQQEWILVNMTSLTPIYFSYGWFDVYTSNIIKPNF